MASDCAERRHCRRRLPRRQLRRRPRARPDIVHLHVPRLHRHRSGGHVDRAAVGNATDAAGAPFAAPRALTARGTRAAAPIPGATAITSSADVRTAVTSTATATTYAATAAVPTVEAVSVSADATAPPSPPNTASFCSFVFSIAT